MLCYIRVRSMNYEKIFVIGFNKCATTTIHHLFKKNNLKSYHQGTKYKEVKWKTLIDDYKCFSDIKFTPKLVKELHQTYPNALFILNTRNINKWIISRFEHGQRAFKKGRASDYYPPSLELIQKWKCEREKFYQWVMKYFKKCPDRLFVVDIDKQNWLKFLGDKLGFKKTAVSSKNVVNASSDYNTIKSFVDTTMGLEDFNYDDTELFSNYKSIYYNNI